MPNTLAKLLFKTASISRKLGKNLTKKDRQWNAVLREWNRLDAQQNFRTNYPELTSSSIVFDLGGYKGQWASDIFSKYLCNIHVFEPLPEFTKLLKERFKNNPTIKIYNFGIGAKEEIVPFATAGDSTSRYLKNNEMIEVTLKKAQSFFSENTFEHIDLMKINIEGGEYELLEHLIEHGLIYKIKNIQVQFHHFIPNAEKLMLNIQKKLEKTHRLTYQFTFLWENWKLK